VASIFKTKRSAGEPAAAMVSTVEEVARYLHVHQSTIYRLLRQKELPAFKVGSDWRFNVESIDKWRFGMAEDARKRINSRPL
jgi:excisionase family DNA binding protein